MGTTSNLLYLLLLYAVLDKDGKLSTSTGLLIGIGIMVATNLNNGNNGCSCQQRTGFNGSPYAVGYNYANPYTIGYNYGSPCCQGSRFLYNNALI